MLSPTWQSQCKKSCLMMTATIIFKRHVIQTLRRLTLCVNLRKILCLYAKKLLNGCGKRSNCNLTEMEAVIESVFTIRSWYCTSSGKLFFSWTAFVIHLELIHGKAGSSKYGTNLIQAKWFSPFISPLICRLNLFIKSLWIKIYRIYP